MKIKEKFKSAIKRGSGEAYLIIKKYPKIDFSNEILGSVVNTNFFDAQSEGTREQYYYDLVQASPQKKSLIYKLIKALKRKRRDIWAIEQLFNLCALFAKDGNTNAKSAIYERYLNIKDEEVPWLGEEAINKINNVKKVDETKSKNKKKYLQKKITYQALKEKIFSDKPFVLTGDQRKSISKSDILKIANDFLFEKVLPTKMRYFRLFRFIKYPYSYKHLLAVLKETNKDENRSLEFCIDSIKKFKGKEIREIALMKLKFSNDKKAYLNLFINNYKKGDAELLFELVKKQNTPNKAHSVIWSIVEIFNINKTKECRKIMEHLYYNLACGPHRFDVAKILKDNGILNSKIKKEIKYDSYLKTRKLAYYHKRQVNDLPFVVSGLTTRHNNCIN